VYLEERLTLVIKFHLLIKKKNEAMCIFFKKLIKYVKDISTPQLDMSARDTVPNSMRSQD
jgi:hypothetical protein